MTELEMIKAFAELEGISKEAVDNIWTPYNPVTDLALNCAARDKYQIEVDYSAFNVACFCDQNCDVTRVRFEWKDDINIAVIECILKSEGLYTE